MKKKGFTLIELLAVIIIISVLVTISSLAVSKTIKKSKIKITNYQKEAIIFAASIIASF